jgi:hypothetical protein
MVEMEWNHLAEFILREKNSESTIDVWGEGRYTNRFLEKLGPENVRYEKNWIRGGSANYDVFFSPSKNTIKSVVVPLSKIGGRNIWVVNSDGVATPYINSHGLEMCDNIRCLTLVPIDHLTDGAEK